MKKILIATAYKGINFGTSLQAYSGKLIYEKLGYEAYIVGYNSNIIPGRNVRIEKILKIFLKTFWRPNLLKEMYNAYTRNLKKEVSAKKKNNFLKFEKEILKPKELSWKALVKWANKKEILACSCGSDQIWNGSNVYIDPIYFLRFSPKNKRIAYAPSIGKSRIESYNQKTFKKYINDIPYLSIREDKGAKIIQELTGREAQVVIDPTLIIDKKEWREKTKKIKEIKSEYIFLYFLDEPLKETKKILKKFLANNDNLEIYSVNKLNMEEYKDRIHLEKDLGPLEFVKMIDNANYVLTDSFHGMAYSINLETQFYVFKRNYGSKKDQSSRILSLLKKFGIEDRFLSLDRESKIDLEEIKWDTVRDCLTKEREKSKKYLLSCFDKIEGKNDE